MCDNKLILFKNNKNFINQVKAKCFHLDSNKKTLLFIEPYGAVNSLLKHALACGHQVFVLTANADFRILSPQLLEAVHVAVQADTSNEVELRALVQRVKKHWRIDGVVPGFEYFVPIASRLSQDLHLPGILPAQVMNVRSKYQMRVLLQKAGLAVPRFYLIQSVQDLPLAIGKITFPAICKPIDAAGSVNVKKVKNRDEANRAALRILQGQDILWGYPVANCLLLEEYIAGKEYSAEGIVQNGKVMHFSITEKFVADQTEFIEIGHLANAPLDPKLKVRIEWYLEQVIQVLQVDHCPFHAEFRIKPDGQPVLMEIAARLAGDRIAELINLAREVNYFDAVLATYLGEKVTVPLFHDSYAGIRFFYRPHIDAYSEVVGLLEARKMPVEEIGIYYAGQQRIPDFPKPLRRLGHVIIKNDNYDYLVKTLAAIDESLVFKQY